jgi:hypothetical protein
MLSTLLRILVHGWPVIISVAVFVGCWCAFWRFNTGDYVYFDPQDFYHYGQGGGRKLPMSAKTGTFEPLLKHYITATQLLITVAAASIAFGGNQAPTKYVISVAKLFLAFAILYGVLFCAFVLYRYDEYTQDVESYTRFWYSTVESLGFACLLCFILGYACWAFSSI